MSAEELLLSERDQRLARWRRWSGLVAAPLVLVGVLALHPTNMAPLAAKLLAVLLMTLLLWVTEALPVAVTALLGPALAVVLGVAPAETMFAAFGNPLLFLFLGSFVMAAAAERTRLDRVLAAKLFPDERTSPQRTLVTTTLVTAAISSLFSNTATTAMMVPVVRAAVAKLAPRAQAVGILTAAFASSIGGVLTPIGTPPNLLAMAALSQYAKLSVPFFHWTLLALPMALATLTVWIVLILRTLHAEQASRQLIASADPRPPQLATDSLHIGDGHGPWGLNRGQFATLLVVAAAALGWVVPGVLELTLAKGDPTVTAVKKALPEGVVAVLAASALFVLPAASRRIGNQVHRRPVLVWSEAVQIDWGTILLFGGGLALGEQVFKTGLSAWIGDLIVQTTGVHTAWGVTILFSTASLILSELTSNTATAAMMCPLAVMTAQQLGLSPVPPVVAAGLAASMGFLMPISTAPNAIVYGTGRVPLGTMMRYGAWLDLTGLLVVPPSAMWVSSWLGLA